MKLEFTKDEIELLCNLVFLGNWVVNSNRLQNNKIETYEKFAKRIEKLHRKILSSEICCKDMSELYFDKLGKYLDEYDDLSCLPTLAEKLAKANFPENSKAKDYCGSIHIQLDAQHIYENELLEKGVSIVNIDIPDIDDQLETSRKVFRKNRPLF